MPLLVIGVTIAAGIPAHIERWTDLEGSGELAEAATALRAATSPDDYVLTDIPAIALMADRVIVPGLVDLSGVRLSTGRISTDFAADQTQKYQPAAILFWLGRLDSGSLESYPAMLRDHYSRVWQNRPGQSLWMREDAATFDPHGIPGMRILTDASFENAISARAIDYSGQVRSGDIWRLRVLWELADELRDIESVQIELATSGEMLISETLPFSPDKPVMAWPPGARRMVQYEIPIPAGLQPSRATPRLELVDRDGAELTLGVDRKSSTETTLELPPIQIVRGSAR